MVRIHHSRNHWARVSFLPGSSKPICAGRLYLATRPLVSQIPWLLVSQSNREKARESEAASHSSRLYEQIWDMCPPIPGEAFCFDAARLLMEYYTNV